MNYKTLITATALLSLTGITGCSFKDELPPETGRPSIENGSGATLGNPDIYENEKYGYRFTRMGEDLSESEHENPPGFSQQTTGILLGGGTANVAVDVYTKGSERYDPNTIGTLGDPPFHPVTINSKQGWQRSSYGTANAWFVTTVFFGKQNIYAIEFSQDDKDQKYLDMLGTFLQGFEFWK